MVKIAHLNVLHEIQLTASLTASSSIYSQFKLGEGKKQIFRAPLLLAPLKIHLWAHSMTLILYTQPEYAFLY